MTQSLDLPIRDPSLVHPLLRLFRMAGMEVDLIFPKDSEWKNRRGLPDHRPSQGRIAIFPSDTIAQSWTLTHRGDCWTLDTPTFTQAQWKHGPDPKHGKARYPRGEDPWVWCKGSWLVLRGVK